MIARVSKFLSNGTRLTSRGARFFRRDAAFAALAIRIAAWVAAVSLMMKIMSLPRVMRVAAPRRRRRVEVQDPAALQAKVARVLDSLLATNTLFLTPSCWKRAIVLHRQLALKGISTRVVFGVRKDAVGLLDGHAWLEADGKPLLEATAPEYAVTYSFPA
jgi:Transglutaminase-like superfamily